MKHDKYKWLGSALCLALMLVTVGCSQDDLTGGDGKTDGVKPTSYVTLSLAMPSSTGTRATGGETGNGLEKGQSYENVIRSAVAFFYQGTGANDTGNPNILAAVSFTFPENDGTDGTSPVDRTYTTQPQEVSLENGTYRVIVVANPGTDWWTGRNLKLDDVRNHIQEQAWTDDGNYSNFLMSLADERDGSAVIELNSNPQDDPAEATVYVERMAARVDYRDGRQGMTCTDPDYQGATVEIKGAALVNNLTKGSYLLKRVADDVNGRGREYLGDETSTNYVLDPWTSDVKPADHFGTPYAGRSQDPSWWNQYVQQPGTPLQGESAGWNLVGYTLENCPGTPNHDENTAVVFKAMFTPVGLPSYWTEGETFFAYGKSLFATMEDMMGWVYGADFANFESKVNDCTTWNDLQEFVTTSLSIATIDPSGYRTYLKNLLESETDLTVNIPDAVKPSLTWSGYMLNECGYSMSGDGHDVTLDQGTNIVTREKLKNYGVRTYVNSMCYYTWWILHNDDVFGPMEYAVVRNNIYKLTVTSIYTLGGDIPEEDNGLELVVYVNDWRLLEPEKIYM